jgi:hypothetical protein
MQAVMNLRTALILPLFLLSLGCAKPMSAENQATTSVASIEESNIDWSVKNVSVSFSPLSVSWEISSNLDADFLVSECDEECVPRYEIYCLGQDRCQVLNANTGEAIEDITVARNDVSPQTTRYEMASRSASDSVNLAVTVTRFSMRNSELIGQ